MAQDGKYFLVIDEINRGYLAKVRGRLIRRHARVTDMPRTGNDECACASRRRIVELRLETVTPVKEILGLPSDLRPVCTATVAFDTTVPAVTFPVAIFSRGCSFWRGELATHFLKPSVAASVNRANFLKTDVWKTHSDDVDILPDLLLAQRQRFVQHCVK